MGPVSKKGDPYLRKLLVLGATAVIRYAQNKPELAGWINALRIAWAVMSRGETFRQASSAIA